MKISGEEDKIIKRVVAGPGKKIVKKWAKEVLADIHKISDLIKQHWELADLKNQGFIDVITMR